MNEPVRLGTLYEALLDDARLDALLTDLELVAEVIDVRVKGGALQRSDGAQVPLEAAKQRLLSGQAMGVQIFYRHQGKSWTDTLMTTQSGIRLVRCEHPAARVGVPFAARLGATRRSRE